MSKRFRYSVNGCGNLDAMTLRLTAESVNYLNCGKITHFTTSA